MEDKTNKYDFDKHIPLDTVQIEDLELFVTTISRGSVGMMKCIREMFIHGLKTYSCYPGSKNSFDIGYIKMEEDEDIFAYLSEPFIFDPRIRIDEVDGMQRIRFAGNKPEKEGALLFLTREIQRGIVKGNEEAIKKKLGEPYPDGWVRRLKSYAGNVNSTYWSERVLIQKKPNSH